MPRSALRGLVLVVFGRDAGDFNMRPDQGQVDRRSGPGYCIRRGHEGAAFRRQETTEPRQKRASGSWKEERMKPFASVPSPSMVVAVLALFVALGGTGYAA